MSGTFDSYPKHSERLQKRLSPLYLTYTSPTPLNYPYTSLTPYLHTHLHQAGGNMSGTFDPYPKHSEGVQKKANLARAIHIVNNTGRIFMPNTCGKTAPVFSTLALNVDRFVHDVYYSKLYI